MVDWSEIQSWRQKFRKKFPRIQKLPILPSIQAYLTEYISCDGSRATGHGPRTTDHGPRITVLDVGAGYRDLFDKLDKVHDVINYKSQDVDRRQQHDFYSTEEINEQFDVVVSSEVIEHLDAEGKCNFIDELFRLTKPGGCVAVSTPNANHPNIFWRDFTHIMPIHYYDLAGLLGKAGYKNIEIYRIAKLNWKKKITVWRYRKLLDLIHSDFAQSILAVGRKSPLIKGD